MMDFEREGQDITASDMIVSEEDSDIKHFFNNSTVFVTGVTGFLGKLALEKLLYICEDVKIFVLIRKKNGMSAESRLTDIFNELIFERLKRIRPNFKENVHVISGDVCYPNFKIQSEDLETLTADVDCIMNFAATKKIDEHIKLSTYTNVASVKYLIELAKRMKHLKAFLHISTVFSSLGKEKIIEEFCEAPISSEKLLSLVECLDNDQLRDITDIILKKYPNTYVFTKCVAEDYIKSHGQSLPIVLFRPSIAIATAKDPVSGWIDTIHGVTGALIWGSLGVLRSLHCQKKYKAELVPADYIIIISYYQWLFGSYVECCDEESTK
ncbi:fatty acyl-CoA reductase wat-like isoform X1 [Rhynchophorus ferrugineus]|uniref:fatty acyl-CoA reductase wat-like isoform X1 n=1 Tax=Rhynchophorus ferrugineus TaxID=354439 RepID=UPI003FCDCB0A